MDITESLQWRYATKKFDASKPAPEDLIDKLKDAIALSATSYGLQPYKVFVISDVELRQQLLPHSWNQSQIVDCSHLIVFASQKTVSTEDVDLYIQRKAEVMEIGVDELKGYSGFMKSKIAEMSPEQQSVWTTKQSYIALGTAMAAAATFKLDTCPLEGIVAEEYDKILSLDEQNLKTDVALAVGYRHSDDASQNYQKVRKPFSDVFERR